MQISFNSFNGPGAGFFLNKAHEDNDSILVDWDLKLLGG